MRKIQVIYKDDNDYGKKNNEFKRFADDRNESEMDLLNDLIGGSSFNKDKKSKKKKKDKEKKKDKKKKKKKKSLLKKGLGIDIYDESIVKKPVGKNDEDFYSKRFSTSLVLLKDMLHDTNEVLGDSREMLSNFKKTSQRGSFTAITNQTNNVATLLNTKLNIIKEITTVNTKISDLELKKAKEMVDKTKEEDMDDNYLFDKMFGKILSSEVLPNEKTKKKKKKSSKKDAEDYLELENAMEEDLTPEQDYFDSYDDIEDAIEKRVKKLEKEGKIEFSDNENAFKYENEEVEVCIKYNEQTQRWTFMAYDSTGHEIDDYPVPTKTSAGNVKLDHKKCTGRDSLGNIYPIRYFTDDMLAY